MKIERRFGATEIRVTFQSPSFKMRKALYAMVGLPLYIFLRAMDMIDPSMVNPASVGVMIVRDTGKRRGRNRIERVYRYFRGDNRGFY